MRLISVLTLLLICCNNDKNIQQPATKSQTDSAKIIKAKKEFVFSSVSLFTIDPSFYNQPDTIYDFPDGKHAYENVFDGAGFIDSSGVPIHNRYRKYDLTSTQINTLRGKFLSKLCFGYRKMCMTTYRD